jgi:tetratricopeptide (TPR) repeat protein
MKLTTSTAIALAAGFIAAPAAAQYNAPTSSQQVPAPGSEPPAQAEAKIKISERAAKAILDLQTAVNANDVANIPAKVAAAKAVAKTNDDRYAIGRLELNAASKGSDIEAIAGAVDDVAASKFLPNATVAALYNSVGVKFFNAKNTARATAMFQKALAIDPNNADTTRLLAESQAAGASPAEAMAAMKRTIAQAKASGQKLPEDTYQRAVKVAYDAKSPETLEFGRQWVEAYPSPSSWHDALAIYRGMGNPDPSLALDIMRLASATNSMRGTADYNIYAGETINSQNYGEAKAVMTEGLSSGKIKASDPIVQDIQKALKGKSSPTTTELAAREAGAKTPTAFLRVGDAYYGAGNYQKAAELYRKAVAAGADKNVANLRLGEALARGGDKAGATSALNAVGGLQTEVAKFWLLYVQRQG